MNGYKKDYHLDEKFIFYRDLREMLKQCARDYGEKTAFITKVKGPGKEVSYRHTSYTDLYGEMVRLGTALIHRGYQGARLAVVGKNSYPWVLAYITCACGVGVTVPLDAALEEEELTSCLIRSGARVVFYDEKHLPMIRSIMASGRTELEAAVSLDFNNEEDDWSSTIESLLREGDRLVKDGDFSFLHGKIDPEAMSFLLFTSGTTQRAKAVMLSHRNLMSCNYGMNCEELFFPDDVNLIILPLHHIYGFSGLVTFLSQGLTNCFCDGLKYIQKNLIEYQVTVFTSVPLLLENMYKKIQKGIDKKGQRQKVEQGLRLAAAADRVGIDLRKRLFKPIHDEFGGHLRFIINGASALDPAVQKGFNELGILTVQGYGLTETSPTISSETYRYLRPGSCGKLMPNVTARIEEPDENGVGELVVKGGNVMLGYYHDPKATKEVLREGWFHTGDLARFDKDGYLYISGRQKNVIVMKNGKNVFPEEIESLINLFPYVSESMVFGRDRGTDLVLWAKIVADPAYLREEGLTMADVQERLDQDMEKLNESLPAYKMIKRYFLSDRPTVKTTTQKTRRTLEMDAIEAEIQERGLK